MTSSNETSRQMYPLTRCSGNAVRCLLLRSRNGQPAMNRILSRCVGVSGNMRLLSVVNGKLAVFLHVHCSPLGQHLVIQFGTAAAYGLPSVILILLSVDEYPAQWLHPQSSASVLCASFVQARRGGRCGRIQLQKRDGRDRCELCRVKSSCVHETGALRICFPADEFNIESALMILIERAKF